MIGVEVKLIVVESLELNYYLSIIIVIRVGVKLIIVVSLELS